MGTPPQILLVIYSGFLGGAERSMLDCAAAVNGEEFAVNVACPPDSAVSAESQRLNLATYGVEFPRLDRAGMLRRLPAASIGMCRCVGTLKKLIRSLDSRLVHANGLKSALPAAAAASLARVPFVYHVRDFPRVRAIELPLTRQAAAVIAPTRFILDALRADPRRCHLAPNGIDLPATAPQPGAFRKAARIPEGAPLVAMVAQLAPWKRHDLFIDAAALLRRHRPDAYFYIAGGDVGEANRDYAQALHERAVSRGLSGRLEFGGHREDAQSLMAECDALVLPSDKEPFGRVVVEGWHLGAPVVVTGGSGPAELVEHGVTGLVAKQGCAESIANMTARLLDDQALRESLARAGKRQARQYSVSAHARQVAQIYGSLLK